MNLTAHIPDVLARLTPDEQKRLESAIDLPGMVRLENELAQKPRTNVAPVTKPATRSRFLDYVI